MNNSERLKEYWADVRAGRRAAPVRKSGGEVRRKVSKELDGSFGCDADKHLVVTLHRDGRIDLRPEGTRRQETIHAIDVYRFAIRCRVGRGQLEKARVAKSKRAERLAAQRQERAERRLVERQVEQ